MADATTGCKKLDEVNKPVDSADACAAALYPTEDEDYQVRLTGLYIPPSAAKTADGLDALANDASQTKDKEGKSLSHLMVGDFNPNCWKGDSDAPFREWVANEGLWELSNPREATYVTGPTFAKSSDRSVQNRILERSVRQMPEFRPIRCIPTFHEMSKVRPNLVCPNFRPSAPELADSVDPNM